LQVVADYFGAGIDDTHIKMRGAPVLEEPSLSSHQKMIADKLTVSELMTMAVVALPPVVKVCFPHAPPLALFLFFVHCANAVYMQLLAVPVQTLFLQHKRRWPWPTACAVQIVCTTQRFTNDSFGGDPVTSLPLVCLV